MTPVRATSMLRLLPAPAIDPPYDDERTDPGPAVDGNLALAFPPPTPPVVPLRLVPPALPAPARPGTVATGQRLPDPRAWCRQLAQAVVEVLAGSRGAGQLNRFATLPVLEQLERSVGRLGGLVKGGPALRPTVRSVHVCLPRAGAAEACAVVDTGRRRRALALRIEVRDGRWLCTALEVG